MKPVEATTPEAAPVGLGAGAEPVAAGEEFVAAAPEVFAGTLTEAVAGAPVAEAPPFL